MKSQYKSLLITGGIVTLVLLTSLSYNAFNYTEPTELELVRSSKQITAFKANSLSKKTIDIKQYENKIILINFWATWCTPCIAEIKELVLIQKKRRKHVQIIGILMDNDLKKAKQLAKKLKINYPIIHRNTATKSKLAQFGLINSVPTTFLLDKNLILSKRIIGSRDGVYLNGVIDSLLESAI